MADMLNVRQTARVLGVHENTVRNWEKEGIIRAAEKLPHGWKRFDLHEVARVKAEMEALRSRVETVEIYEVPRMSDFLFACDPPSGFTDEGTYDVWMHCTVCHEPFQVTNLMQAVEFWNDHTCRKKA